MSENRKNMLAGLIKKMLPYVNVICIVVIVITCCAGVANLISSNNNAWALNGDIIWSCSFADGILQAKEYPIIADKPAWPIGYPVPMLLLLQVVRKVPAGVFSAFMMLSYAIIPLLSLYLLQRLCDLQENSYRWVISLFAFFVTWDYIQFDIRAFNINVILVFLILLALYYLKKNREILAGVLLAFTIVLKLYSVFLIPLWLYKKRYAALLSCCVTLVCCFILLPAFIMGYFEAYELTIDWLLAMKSTATAQASMHMICYLVSFNRAIVTSLGGIRGGDMSVLSAESWAWLNIGINVFKVLWLGFTVYSICIVERLWKSDGYIRQVALLLVMPISISPLLQPHHLVLILPAVFIICSVVVQPGVSGLSRCLAAGVLVLVFVFSQIIQIEEAYRGFLFAAISLAVMLAVTWLPLIKSRRSSLSISH